MTKRIAAFGTSCNPPTLAHEAIFKALDAEYDEVIVVPCGPRPDKLTVEDTPSIFRAIMADMAYGPLGAQVDLFDLESDEFTRTIDLQKRYVDRGEIYHVVGEDLFRGGQNGQSEIQTSWKNGEEVWNTFRFVVIPRKDEDAEPFDERDLPPHSQILEIDRPESSTQVRTACFERRAYKHLVPKRVGDLIERYGLYTGQPPRTSSVLHLEDVRLSPATSGINRRSPAALALRHRLGDDPSANVLYTAGGDGTLLDGVRGSWRNRLPYLGCNVGHLGWLLNDRGRIMHLPDVPMQFETHLIPMLYVEAELLDGTIVRDLGVNDVWMERATGQTAWVRVVTDGQERFESLGCDVLLVSTPAGSTAYANALGAPRLLLNTPALLLVGGAVSYPRGWNYAMHHIDTVFELECVDPDKRPIEAFCDGRELGRVQKLTVRRSRIAAVELAFLPGHDFLRKITDAQYP